MKKNQFRGFPVGNVFSLSDLLPVPAHQVVSLTALDRQHPLTGEEERLACFAFDAGEGITRDIQHLDILYIVIDGQVSVEAGDTVHTLCPGQCILVPAHMPHAINALSSLRLMQLSVC